MEDILYLIAFISTTWYGCNLLADCMVDNRPINSHIGYGIVSILSTYYLVPSLFVIMCITVICYSAVTLFIYLDKNKQARRSNNV